MSRFRPELPEIFPQGGIKVTEEPHKYRTYEGGSFEPIIEEREYTLDKAPIDEIVKIEGVASGKTITFEKGTDYTLSAEGEEVVWKDDPATRPDAGSTFYVTYRCDSILSRYIDSAEEEFHTVDHKIEETINSKFIDKAEGQDLDELGKIFGVLGKRRGRDDLQYRIYLKSVVQSFISRGTVQGIKLAVSAATDIPIRDITINEDFEENEYEVEVIPNNPVSGNIIEEVAEIADPSGVELLLTRFAPEPEEIVIDDSESFTLGEQIPDTAFVNDSNASTRRQFGDVLNLKDANAINPNKFATADILYADDVRAVDPNKSTVSEILSVDDLTELNPNLRSTSDSSLLDDEGTFTRGEANEDIKSEEVSDAIPRELNTARWEPDDNPERTHWNYFEWTELIDLGTTVVADTLFSGDTPDIPPKDAIVAETSLNDDVIDVRFNVNRVFDDSASDDTNTINPNVNTVGDSGGSADAFAGTTETSVAWDTQDWGTLEWVQEHN